jgi:hypothetical protein
MFFIFSYFFFLSREMNMATLEETLTEKTKEAITVITKVLELPDITEFPSVISHPDQSAYSFFRNTIQLQKDDPIHIFEEAGHYVHDTFNIGTRLTGYTLFSTYTTFFTGVLSEAIGYFCSKLSGSNRHAESVHEWKLLLDQYSEMYTLVQQMKKDWAESGLMPREQLEKETAEMEEKCKNVPAERALAHSGEKLFDILDTSTTGDAVWHILYLIEDCNQEMKTLNEEDRSKVWTSYHHVMGYQLGSELHTLHVQGKEVIPIVKEMLFAKVDDAPKTFFKIYRELKEMGIYLNKK